MKKELRRIEETLHQLTHPAPLLAIAGSAPHLQATPPALKALSFTVHPRPARPEASPAAVVSVAVTADCPLTMADSMPAAPSTARAVPAYQPQPWIATDLPSAPNLPKFKVPSFSSHRHAANPALATNLLQDMQQIIGGWQRELSQILRQIQDLYLEGPIVDGWLESHPNPVAPESPILRHGEVDHLMNYVEAICAAPTDAQTTPDYRLCGLNQAGELWSSPCPPDQVPTLSLAIARHQKLRQLLARQQHLETRLSQLAETLVLLHGQLKET